MLRFVKRKIAESKEASRRRHQAELEAIEREREAKREAEEQERQALFRKQEREKRAIAQHQQMQQNILYILDDGKLPEIDWSGNHGALPFKFLKSEHLIYVFDNVGYFEQRASRRISGRSGGASVRVAKGVYLRGGASEGVPVEYEEILDRGTGIMAVTTKHVYFSGERSFRVNFNKIVAIELADGETVSITRDRASQQPEFFVVGKMDALFAHALLRDMPANELDPSKAEMQSPGDYHMLMHGGEDYFFEE